MEIVMEQAIGNLYVLTSQQYGSTCKNDRSIRTSNNLQQIVAIIQCQIMNMLTHPHAAKHFTYAPHPYILLTVLSRKQGHPSAKYRAY